MSDEDSEIGKNLARIRGQKTQQEVADAMRKLGWKWSQATVWSIEKGERPLRLAEARDVTTLLSKRLEDLLVPPVEAVIVDGLNQGMAKISDVRDSMRDVVETWESERALLQHAVDFAGTTFDKEWDDPALKDRAIRTSKVAEEVLSWTPESMVKSILKEKRGKHPEEA